MIGDPSGRQKTRPMLTPDETAANAKSYVDQVTKILDASILKIQYNSTWLNAMNFTDVIKLAATYTVSQMLEREDFHKRFNEELPISLHEFLYPLAQGMDSVAIHSDVELGGTDQKFNLLVGRELQKHFGQRPQNILTMPILEGTDGERKMSKSYGNSINFNDSPDDMFGKSMSIPDALIYRYFELATNVPDLDGVKAALDDSETNPRNLKVRLGQELVRSFYGEDAAREAYDRFTTMFVKKEIPDDIPEMSIGAGSYMLADFIAEHQLATSKSEARRLIQGGGVSIDGEKVIDERASFSPSTDGVVLKVGKRKFLKVRSAV
jgi:tyrosyl-tRNA synthetase